MRKVTRETVRAFREHRPLRVGNTETDGWEYRLHGNVIAENDGAVMVSLRGWNTPTTRDRLNGIAQEYGYPLRFAQRDFAPIVYHTGHGEQLAILSNEWYFLDDILHSLNGIHEAKG